MSVTDISDSGRSGDVVGRDSAILSHLPVAVIFHWITAVFVMLMFASGIVMTQLGGGPLANFLSSSHKLTGFCLLLLILARLIYRMQARLRGRWLPQIGNHTVHRVMYAALVLVPLLGWAGISDYGARETLFGIVLPKIWPEGLGYDHWLFSGHVWMAFGLIALVVIHIGVALQDYVMRGQAGQMPTVDQSGTRT
jgi:cytochrome b561